MSASSDSPQAGSNPVQANREEELVREVIRLSRNVLGLTLGILCAGGIFLATNILVLKGGAHVGLHLQLLNQFFPGYSVTVFGSIIGAAYAFVAGYISGWIIATVYNWVVLLRQG
ncbi:MAG TPA: hypothetical protein VGM62_01680 [Chthoniobacterales bacterium]